MGLFNNLILCQTCKSVMKTSMIFTKCKHFMCTECAQRRKVCCGSTAVVNFSAYNNLYVVAYKLIHAAIMNPSVCASDVEAHLQLWSHWLIRYAIANY
ncbi:hypothetical protein [Scale drop disease virus]|uniref:RING-type domain-containing protein n=1 Tax=Scale drop disease virus TaxID=1697349 RepID=A0A7D5UL53_9VIRU|nr:hypothetical protein [Scale drop disease virus]QXJ13679.1 hypothetical protein PMJGCIOK_00113 [Scale drop disease virus]